MLSARKSMRASYATTLGRRLASTYAAEKFLKKYPVGAKVHGFEIKKVLPVPEFSMTAVELHHIRTGAKHLHIDRDDKNNVFSISFKTNPPDKTGVPHILEHTTLCGSEKYPVRDPFFKMLNRSLANFMNAMTGHDYTFFPFATTNKIDYENLADVYLDATLNPLLKEEDFQQEGWRLENEITDDKSSPLIFKGVVYNEMKGQVSNSSYYHWIKFQEAFYPSLNNSGGDPQKITDLQYFDLVDFQSKNYHPSNARIVTYGSFPVVPTLEKLDEKFKAFGKRGSRNLVKKPIPLDKSTSVTVDGPIDPMLPDYRQFKTSVTWYVGDPKDSYSTFLFKILSNLLMDGHSAPLYKGLIESGLGDDFSANSGFESITSVNTFTVGVQGLTEESSAKLTEHVAGILNESVQTGFDEKRVSAILHQLELSKKLESAEFGMSMVYSITPAWANDVDPFELLRFEEMITRFKKDFKDKGSALFTNLIQTQLIDSPSFTFTMRPVQDFQDKVSSEEVQRLAEKTKDLTQEDRDVLYHRGLQLQEKQNEQEDLTCLPTLQIDDIPVRGEVADIEVNGNVFKRASPKANGLTYFRAKKDITNIIPLKLLPFLPLFTECLTNLGTVSKEMSELGEEIKLFTGGLSASVGVSSLPSDISQPVLNFFLSGVAMNENTTKMFRLLSEMIVETNFHNQEKLSILIKSLNSDNMNSIINSGHSYAKSFGSARFSRKAAYDDLLGGVKQVQFLSQLSKWNEEGLLLEKVVPPLIKLQQLLSDNKNFKIFVTSDPDKIDSQIKQSTEFISQLPSLETAIVSSEILPIIESADYKSFIKVPSQVQFSSKSMPGVPYDNKDGAALQVASQLLTFKMLHREIREKGGAYGGGSGYDALNGVFNFYSYRDPNPLNSMNTFSKAGEYMIENISDDSMSIVSVTEADSASPNAITQSDLDQAKLSIFQKVDAPISVKEEGLSRFLYGIDDSMKQRRRRRLLEVTLSDVKDVTERYLVSNGISSSCLIGAELDEKLSEIPWDVTDMSA